ncbi:NfeD family protein [Jeongeupia naejangsanensis]|uniref:NfeD family protein n=1 Tax=Jeongeupia naejangsanensis TaxID=613195 RepID=A0ABS2BIJ1_9NEIS|nr:NfeD family protein [Jeongeupia naejangsanensis]MBM3115422.1 NfeD family protein [Jeongeupia naejangsanensis]
MIGNLPSFLESDLIMTPTTIWLIAAAVLVGLEMLSGTFYLLAIAAGMLAGAIAGALSAPLALQIAVATVASLIAVAGLRRWKRRIQPKHDESNALDLGHKVTVEHWLDARHARVRYRGADWDAEFALPADQTLTQFYIVGQRGNTLLLDATPPQS